MKKFKIDLFSDTNTNPSIEMRRAMCDAEVGNEVAAEDPTVNKLIDEVCDLLGKEAALFLPSGTMCNGIAFRVLCQRPGDMILMEESSHVANKSAGLIGGLVQAQAYLIYGHRGMFKIQDIESILNAEYGYNLPRPRVVSIEQATNFGGGAIWPIQTIKEICLLAHQRGAYTHMDGAHLLNAVVETAIPAQEYAEPFDSVWIDFSKSLGAPMGAVLAGSKSFIEEAWYYKFQQGGGMHQAGILAAGCLYGLKHNLSRLPGLHDLARKLAMMLEELDFIKIEPKEVETNIIVFQVNHPKLSAFDIQEYLEKKLIRVLAMDDKNIRIMIHLDISEKDIHEVFLALQSVEERVSLNR